LRNYFDRMRLGILLNPVRSFGFSARLGPRFAAQGDYLLVFGRQSRGGFDGFGRRFGSARKPLLQRIDLIGFEAG
jgi:hypothetical protein